MGGRTAFFTWGEHNNVNESDSSLSRGVGVVGLGTGFGTGEGAFFSFAFPLPDVSRFGGVFSVSLASVKRERFGFCVTRPVNGFRLWRRLFDLSSSFAPESAFFAFVPNESKRSILASSKGSPSNTFGAFFARGVDSINGFVGVKSALSTAGGGRGGPNASSISIRFSRVRPPIVILICSRSSPCSSTVACSSPFSCSEWPLAAGEDDFESSDLLFSPRRSSAVNRRGDFFGDFLGDFLLVDETAVSDFSLVGFFFERE